MMVDIFIRGYYSCLRLNQERRCQVIDPAIDDFFAERKAAWLKKNISVTMQEWEVREKEQECEYNFLLANWLPDEIGRAHV